jgi:hypothetical protein
MLLMRSVGKIESETHSRGRRSVNVCDAHTFDLFTRLDARFSRFIQFVERLANHVGTRPQLCRFQCV